MSKDNNKILAELLGTKKKRIFKKAETDLYKLAEKYDSIIYYDEKTDYYFIDIDVDFQDPVNFVKKLECLRKAGIQVLFAKDCVRITFGLKFITKDTLIDCLLLPEIKEGYNIDCYLAAFKREMQATQWKY